ncbi:MAG: extracellular solute-binding protein [Actinobacteria bacterium]|nr:extracellular solute-binding protein [Actinomycetota bacterium]
MLAKLKKTSVMFLVLAIFLSLSLTFTGCKEEAAEEVAEEVEEAVEEVEEEVAEEVEEPVEEVEEEAAEPVTITWWDWQAELGINLLDALFAKYSEENPNVTIERRELPYADYNTALKTDLAAGIGPDLFAMEPGAPTVALVNESALLPLTDYVMNDEEWLSWLGTSINMQGMYVGDDIYTIPIDVNHLPIVYWKEMFESRGLEVPETVEELIAVSDALEADGIIPLTSMFGEKWPHVDMWVCLVRGADPTGDLLDRAVAGEASWEDPLFKEAMQAIVDLKDEGVLPPNIMELGWNECLDLFGKKENAMVYAVGNFGLDALPREALENEEIGTFPMPKLNEDAELILTGGVGFGLVANANGKNIETAVDVMKFMCSPVAQEAVFDNMSTPPGNVVDKKSPIPLFDEMTRNQSAYKMGYRRIDNPDLYSGLSEAIDKALLGGNIDDIFAELESLSQQVNG